MGPNDTPGPEPTRRLSMSEMKTEGRRPSNAERHVASLPPPAPSHTAAHSSRAQLAGENVQQSQTSKSSFAPPPAASPSRNSSKAYAMSKALSLLNPEPDRMKMEKIIKTLLGDVKGVLSVKQVQLLFSKLLGIPQEDIGEDHEAVVAFAGLEAEVAVET